jgi:hypothetical protein
VGAPQVEDAAAGREGAVLKRLPAPGFPPLVLASSLRPDGRSLWISDQNKTRRVVAESGR